MRNSNNVFIKMLDYSKLAAAYVKLNWLSHIEYRGAFYITAGGMFINNMIWVAFWAYFFKTFPSVPGWETKDLITLWAISAGGFGLAFVLFGNSRLIASLIMKGELDAWMLYPRNLLSHLILGKMNASAFGDMVFGLVIYLVFIHPDLLHLLLFSVLIISVAILFTAFSIIVGSLSFFIGNAESLAMNSEMALICFSTYPSPLFEGRVRLLLYTLIPAMFVSYYPIEALRTLSIANTLYAIGGALTLLLVAIIIFYFGLRRYESGNLTTMRG
jgi:ABC-2 type transport system permease protein